MRAELSGGPVCRFVMLTGFLCFALHFANFALTNIHTRTYDSDGHLTYITLMSERFSFIGSAACWECYHPPLYYWTAGLLVRISTAISLPVEYSLKGLALFSFGVFLSSASLVIWNSNFTPVARSLALALVLLWPANIFHSVRIGNDTFLYAFNGIALLCAHLWTERNKASYFFLATLIAAGSILVKANGAVVLTAILTTAFRLGRLNISKVSNRLWVICIAISIGCIASYLWVASLKGGIVSNAAALPHELAVSSDIHAFVERDLGKYFESIFASPWLDVGGRQNFWVFAMKTALFGEFSHPQIIPCLFGMILIILLPLLIAISAFAWSAPMPHTTLHAITLATSVGALAFNRAMFPYSCSNDFRYIFVVIISFSVLVGDGLNALRLRNRRLILTGCSMAIVVFVVSSFLFGLSVLLVD